MKLQACNDKIVAKEIEQEMKTEGGIVLMESTTKSVFPQIKCEVISVGPDVKSVKEGDVFYTHIQSGQMIAVTKDEFYRVYNDTEIYCVIEE